MKVQYMRKLFLVLLIPLGTILLLIVVVYSVVQFNEYKNKEAARQKSIGSYVFAFEYSNTGRGNLDSLFLDGLELTLKEDCTFSFSKAIPFIRDSVGTWRIEGFGVHDYIMLYFNNGVSWQTSNCCGPTMEIEMSYPLLLDKDRQEYITLGFRKK